MIIFDHEDKTEASRNLPYFQNMYHEMKEEISIAFNKGMEQEIIVNVVSF